MLSQLQTDDRRDIEMRDALLARFRHEIQHTPGLALTPDQASRLFGMRALAYDRILTLRSDGRFVGLAPVRES